MITDRNETAAFLAELKKFSGKEIHAGILAKENSELQIIAASNEFGAVIKSEKARKWFFANMHEKGIKPQKGKNSDGNIHIPERAAIRKAFDKSENITEVFKNGQLVFDKTGSILKAVNAMGSTMVGKIQESYLSNIQPSNHPFTTEMKGGKDKTLVASGRLQQAVSYTIE